MAGPEDFNADQLAFWNGVGGRIWVARQRHTDITAQPLSAALLALAAARPGERVLDLGCGCGASTIEIARAVGPTGHVEALDISGPMLTEGRARAQAAGIANIDWRQADAATAELQGYDLLVSNFGAMFFGDPVAAFAHLRAAANPGARMALVCWRPLAENPWMRAPMEAVRPLLPPRPPANPQAPGMFAFADPARITQVLTGAGWPQPRIEPLDVTLDIAAGQGLEAAVAQSTQIGAVNSWLRGQPPEVIEAATEAIRRALAPYRDGEAVRLPGAAWLVSCP